VPIKAGGPDVTVTVKGVNLSAEDTYTFGNGIVVHNPTPTAGTPDSIDLPLTAVATAYPGSRTLVVVKKDCSTATFADAINVVAPAPAAAPPAAAGQAPSKPAVVVKPSQAKAGSGKGTKKPAGAPQEQP
jgi:hypothetical protein